MMFEYCCIYYIFQISKSAEILKHIIIKWKPDTPNGKVFSLQITFREIFCINQIHHVLHYYASHETSALANALHFLFIVSLYIYLVTAKLCLTKGFRKCISIFLQTFLSLSLSQNSVCYCETQPHVISVWNVTAILLKKNLYV